MEFEKCDMHVILIESMTILSLIIVFEHEFVLIFFHVNSIIEFRFFFQSWILAIIFIIIVGVSEGLIILTKDVDEAT
jgi:hypothetical protein